MLIDSHAHLDAPVLLKQLPAVLKNAKRFGVAEIISIGVTPASSRTNIGLAAEHPQIHATAGYHPHWAGGATSERLSRAQQYATHTGVAAVGEIGLDYHHLRSPRRDQIRVFQEMLEIAVETKLPVVIHDRKAHEDVYRILSGFRRRLTGGVIHCFSGDWTWAQKYLDWGFFLSIPGTVTYPRFGDLREVARKMPLENMLIETDAPHLTPAPRKGRRNEPAFIHYTATEIAGLRGIDPAELARTTAANVHRAFRIQKGQPPNFEA